MLVTVGRILVVTSYKPHDHDLEVELHNISCGSKATGQDKDIIMPDTITCLEILRVCILTHCGRVTEISVFNTVKLGTSASSP